MGRSIYDAIRPLHLISKLTGLALFSLEPGSFVVKFKLCDAFFVAFNLCIAVALNSLYWTTYFNVEIHSSQIIKTFMPTIAYFNYVTFTLAKIWNFTQRHKFGTFFKLIHEIDGQLAELGIKFDFSQRRKVVIGLIFFIIFSPIGIIFAMYYTQRSYKMQIGWNVFLFMGYGITGNSVVVNLFVAGISAIKERLKAINQVIR